MENRKFIKTFLVFFLILFIFPFFVSAYNDKTTHPALTDEIVDLFNHYYPDFQISSQEKEDIKKGSVEEDAIPRWMQHFFDPVYNRGLVLGTEWEKSKDWAKDTLAQAKYDPVYTASLGTITRKLFSSNTDYSWDRAVYEYVWGDKQKGLEALGHTLHLLEDATVPDHTRNDVHLPFLNQESFYEDWASQFTDKNFTLADKLINKNEKPLIYSDLNQYFDNNAVYSNNNFFSRDTTPDKDNKYFQPLIIKEKEEILKDKKIHLFGYNNNNIRLTEIRKQRNLETGSIDKIYVLNDDDNLTLTDYWNLLSEEAVLSGAGVIKLFFDDVEKEKNSKILLSKNTSFFGKMLAGIGNIFSSGGSESSVPNFTAVALPQTSLDIPTSQVQIPRQPATLTSPSAPPKSAESAEVAPPPNLPATPRVAEPSVPPPPPFVPSLPWPGFGGGSNPTEVASPPNPSAPSDTTPPDISFSIPECLNSSSSTSCVIATTTLNLIWQSTSDDLDYFELTQNNQTSTTTATSTIVAVPDNVIYNFSVKAKDKTGNWSASQNIPVEIYIPTFITETNITSDTTFTKARSPYIIENGLTVNSGVTLTIEPGVVIKFFDNESYLVSQGAIKAIGSAAEKIVFTSFKDDAYGGDANADATSTTPTARDWRTIEIQGAGSEFDHVIIRYGGKWFSGITFGRANLKVINTSIILKNSVVEEAGIYGLWLDSASGTVESNTIKNNKNDSSAAGILMTVGSAEIKNNTFETNKIGLRIETGNTSAVNNNTFTSNQSEAISVVSSFPTFSGNSASGNGTNGILITGTQSSDYTFVANLSYVIEATYAVNSGKTLTINSGVVVKFKDSSAAINVSGKMLANGTAASKIVFTSLADDVYAGDTNNDSSIISPQAGDWRSISFISGSATSTLDNVLVRYGGGFFLASGALRIDGSSHEIKNSTFEFNKFRGIWLSNSASTTISGTLIKNHTEPTTGEPTGLYLENSHPTLINVTFQSNKFGIIADGTSSIINGGGIIFESNTTNTIPTDLIP